MGLLNVKVHPHLLFSSLLSAVKLILGFYEISLLTARVHLMGICVVRHYIRIGEVITEARKTDQLLFSSESLLFLFLPDPLRVV